MIYDLSRRAGSVPPGMDGASFSTRRLPAYSAPQGKYYGYSVVAPITRTTVPARSLYGYSANSIPSPKIHVRRGLPISISSSHVSVKPAYSVSSTRYFDVDYPTRTFGNRLSKGYSGGTMSRPEIYEQAYGASLLPGYGRDSYSAYMIAGATMDDSDDLVSTSCKKDNQVLRSVENKIADIATQPAYRKTFVRASSVPPVSRYSINTPVATTKTVKRTVVKGKPVPKVTVRKTGSSDVYYRVPPPKIETHYTTVNRGSDLLTGKEKMCAREFVDLTSPTGTLSLKMRIHNAQDSLAKQGAMLSSSRFDVDDPDIDAEIREIKTKQALRAKSVA